MKIVKFVYPPATGQSSMEEISLRPPGRDRPYRKQRENRIEILNIHGYLVSIITSRTNIKLLKLKKGFYLLREKDLSGKIIRCTKLSF